MPQSVVSYEYYMRSSQLYKDYISHRYNKHNTFWWRQYSFGLFNMRQVFPCSRYTNVLNIHGYILFNAVSHEFSYFKEYVVSKRYCPLFYILLVTFSKGFDLTIWEQNIIKIKTQNHNMVTYFLLSCWKKETILK